MTTLHWIIAAAAVGFVTAGGGWAWHVVHRVSARLSRRCGDWLRAAIIEALDEHVEHLLADPLASIYGRLSHVEHVVDVNTKLLASTNASIADIQSRSHHVRADDD